MFQLNSTGHCIWQPDQIVAEENREFARSMENLQSKERCSLKDKTEIMVFSHLDPIVWNNSHFSIRYSDSRPL